MHHYCLMPSPRHTFSHAACGCNRRGETLYGAGSVLSEPVDRYNVIGTRAVSTTSGVSSVTPTPRATLRVWRSLNR